MKTRQANTHEQARKHAIRQARIHRWLIGYLPDGLIVLLSLAAAIVLVGLGNRYHTRLDMTSTGQQQLAPRTRQLLDQAQTLGDVDIVIVADMRAIDPWSKRAVDDVLDLFAQHKAIHTSQIDVASPEGLDDYTALLKRLIKRDQAGIDDHVRVIGAAAKASSELAQALTETISPALEHLAGLFDPANATLKPARDGLTQWKQVLGINAGPLVNAAQDATKALREPDPARPLPPLAQKEAALKKTLQAHVTELETLADELNKIAVFDATPEQAKTQAKALIKQIRALRDVAAQQADAIARLPRLDILRVADALSANQIALVIGPPGTGIAGIDIDELYQPTMLASDQGSLVGDVRTHAEELLASALSSVLSDAKPIVVLTHSENARVLENSLFFTQIQARLAQRGIDMTEWSVAQAQDANTRDANESITLPDLSALDPTGTRPVVYVILSPDSSASAAREGQLPGPKRAERLGHAVSYLLEHHLPVMVNLNPSILPSYGQADPIAKPLEAFGIRARTDAPLLGEVISTRSRSIETDLSAMPIASDHPIARAIANLPVRLPWAISLKTQPVEGITVTPLLAIDNAAHTIWNETQWLTYWQTARAQRSLLPQQPEYDAKQDARADRYTVALAVQPKAHPTDQSASPIAAGRVVVIGSNSWYANPIAFAYQTIDGRLSRTWPGNAELFEASVYFLAGMDEDIAASASAQAVPMIVQLPAERLTKLRWFLVGGLPLGVLVLGVIWRMVRG